MSRLVVAGGLVVDPANDREERADVLVLDGRIFGVMSERPSDWADAEVVDATGQWVLPGLICLRTHVCEPGFEWKEDVASASRAAAAGGFTTICARPDTSPTNDVRAVTEQIVTRNTLATGARVEPVGAATVGLKGERLSEMGDLRDAGCVAVSTGERAIESAALMRRVFEYARSVGLPVFVSPQERSLTQGAVMNEGAVSVRLGMPAVPAEAEAMALYRDGLLAALAGWKLHAQRVTTRMGLEVLRGLKARGVRVTADVTPHHLWFSDKAVDGFDADTHVSPPLRSEDDVLALREALAEGLLDCVATDHAPQSSIEKQVEYKWAQPGTTGLETALPVMLELVRQGVLTRTRAIEALTAAPARILGRQDIGRLSKGAKADLVVVDPGTPHRVQAAVHQSRGQNSIFEGASLVGQVTTTLVGGQIVWPTPDESDKLPPGA